jgi:hypothetical protein
METNEISLHLCRVYKAAKDASGWTTSADIAAASGVAGRTARHHLLRLVNLGVLDQAEVFPAHRYKLSDKADKRNKAMVIRLENAMSVFGL